MPKNEVLPIYKNIKFSDLLFHKVYDGKPTVYLDQNILDMIVKYPVLISHGKFVGYDFQVIYSDETLNEIERSGEPNKFLQVLEKLKARQIIFEVNENFQRTGHVAIKPYINPFTVYKTYITADELDVITEDICHNYSDFMFHLFSNKESQNISTFLENDANLFQKTRNEVFKNLEELKNHIPKEIYLNMADYSQSEFEKMTQQYKENQNLILNNMLANEIDIYSTLGQNGIKKYEEITGINGIILNNIEPPNVLLKIYSLYQQLHNFDNVSINDFYLNSGNLFDRELFDYEKVSNIYLILNILGYKRDKGFHKKQNRLISAQSDGEHLSYACYCDFLFSSDKALIDKAKAIFEFLDIKTNATCVNFTISHKEE